MLPDRYLECPKCSGTREVIGTWADRDYLGLFKAFHIRCICGKMDIHKQYHHSIGVMGNVGRKPESPL